MEGGSGEPPGRQPPSTLDWVGQVMLASDDPTGALLAALLVRHLVSNEDPRMLGFSPASLYGRVGGIAQQAFPDAVGGGSVVGPFDGILADLKRRTQAGQ